MNPIINNLIGIAEIIGALATAGAFWVTWLTLRELKLQTELANNPALKVRFRNFEKLPSDSDPTSARLFPAQLNESPHNQWLNLITKNLDQDLSTLQDDYLVIELSNSGKSEVTKVKLSVELNVRIFENDIIGYPLGPTQNFWDIELILDLEERQKAYVSIANTRYFPIYSFQINDLYYFDVRGCKYTVFDGPESTDEVTNEILRPRKRAIEEEAEHEEITDEIDEEYLTEDDIPF